MIEHVQTGASNAVAVMENGRGPRRSGGRGSRKFTGITITAARTISDLNTQIASAAEEQTSVKTEIDRTSTISVKPRVKRRSMRMKLRLPAANWLNLRLI